MSSAGTGYRWRCRACVKPQAHAHGEATRSGGRSAYKCGHCRGFHLGSDSGMVRRKKNVVLERMRAVEV